MNQVFEIQNVLQISDQVLTRGCVNDVVGLIMGSVATKIDDVVDGASELSAQQREMQMSIDQMAIAK